MSHSIRSILLAYDGSEMAKRAAHTAGELAVRLDASIDVVHVMDYPPPVMTVEASVPVPPEVLDEFRETAKDLLRQAVGLLPPGTSNREVLLEGSAGPALVEHADDNGTELIVIGHRGRSGIERLFLGSISEYVLKHAHCQVLVVKQ